MSGGSASQNTPSQPAGRSAQAYCEAFYSRAAPIHAEGAAISATASNDPIAGLAFGLSTIGDFSTMFAAMDKVAPPTIEPDTAAVEASFTHLTDTLGEDATNPIAALASSVISSMASAGSFSRVNAYLQAHCPLNSSIARRYIKAQPTTSTTTTGTSTLPKHAPVTTAPPVGTQLASFDGEGRVNVITNGNGFDIVDSLLDLSTNTDESTVTSYDAAGNKLMQLAPGSLTGECGAADVLVPGLGRIILGYLVTSTPAKGVQPATTSTQIKAWSATTGAQVWSDHLYNSDPGCQAYDGNLQDFSSTPDGRWGVTLNGSVGGDVINLATGAARPDSHLIGALGNYAVDTSNVVWGTDSPTYIITDPSTGVVLAKVPNDGTGNGNFNGDAPGTIGFSGNANLAPSGLFQTDSASDSPPSGTNSDGSELVALPNENGNQPAVAYSLPTLKVLWQTPGSFQPYIVGDGGGTLVMLLQDCDSAGDTCLVGVDDQTGTRLWKLLDGSVCGLTNSQMLIDVNNDFAVINIKTGKQLSYTPDNGNECPQIYSGGLEVGTGADNGDPTAAQTLTVTQGLEP